MGNRPVVLGSEAVGKGVVAQLVRPGTAGVVGRRNEPTELPGRAQFIRTDVLDQYLVMEACRNAILLVDAFGSENAGKVW